MSHRTFSPEYVGLATRVLALLSNATRLRIVLHVAQGEATVTELCDALGLEQSNASHHLGILRNAGLVTDHREGQYVVYRLNVAAWRLVADGFFDHLVGGGDAVTLQNFRIERLPPRDPRAAP